MSRVLLSAYACEPGSGSEPRVGWNWAVQMARFHEVWLLTRSNNREAIERELALRPVANLRLVCYDLPGWARLWKRGPRGVYLYYALWQLGSYFAASRLHRRIGFDLAHQVTFANYWLGSLLPWLPVPFVWGPVGGGESCPRSFRRSFSLRGRAYELLRTAGRWLGEHNPALRLAASRVRVALAATPETGRRLARLVGGRVEVLSQVGMSRQEIAALQPGPSREAGLFRLVSVGRLLHWKGYSLGLLAFAALHREHPGSEYSLIGEGPERRRLERLAEALGLSASVRFLGQLTREQVLRELGSSSALLHPSLHDSAGWACLEAMTAGLPVVCLEVGGPPTLVTARAGLLVPAAGPAQAVADLAEALRKLARDPALGRRLGAAGRQRAGRCFEWGVQGGRMQRIYRSCLD